MTFDYAVEHGYNIMSWPLTRPMAEVDLYLSRLEDAMAKHPGAKRPRIVMMRHTAIYDTVAKGDVPLAAVRRQLSQFENLFKNSGDVLNGFAREIPLDELGSRPEYDPDMLSANLMFGTPAEAIAKLKTYEERGVDAFMYYASLGLGLAEQKRSLELFCKEVMPAFS
jgi:alkanesulfonate monooxygenase SsuD/methylene tetrahydromethanopterin reductase-like flavin-dependent oxidoreductase (luciferase family)